MGSSNEHVTRFSFWPQQAGTQLNSIIQISTTSDDLDELNAIASNLIESRLAACCQVSGPVTSLYTWEGKTESAKEWTCTIKTTKQQYAKVEAMISQQHHYDQPEIIAVEIVAASTGYQKWICDCVAK